MTEPAILAKLAEIMADVFDDDHLHVTAATTAEDVEEWDSLSHIRLVVAVEREFGIKFTNAEIESFKNVGDLAQVVANKTGVSG